MRKKRFSVEQMIIRPAGRKAKLGKGILAGTPSGTLTGRFWTMQGHLWEFNRSS